MDFGILHCVLLSYFSSLPALGLRSCLERSSRPIEADQGSPFFVAHKGVSGTMMDHKNSALLGQLLVRAGVLDPRVLDVALENARVQQIRLGQVLLYSGLVVEDTLKAALQAQRMVRQSILTLSHAVEGIKAVVAYGIDLNTAIARLRWLSGHRQIHQFARLVLDAGILNVEQLGQMLALSIKNSMPLGRMLVMHDFITVDLRETVLDALIFVMCGELSYDHAAAAVRAAHRTGQTLAELLGLHSSALAILGHEFKVSGLFQEMEIADIVEDSLQRETLWQGVYVTENLTAHLRFAASLTLSKMLDDGSISAAHARQLCKDLLLSTTYVLDRIEMRCGAPPAEAQRIA